MKKRILCIFMFILLSGNKACNKNKVDSIFNPGFQPTAGTPAAAVSPDDVCGGDEIQCFLKDGTVKCAGNESNGQLGQGNNSPAGNDIGDVGGPTLAASPILDFGGGRTVKAMTCSDLGACAILSDDSVKCWGEGFLGQTGQGAQTDIGVNGGLQLSAVPSIDFGGGRTVKQIDGGSSHYCAILSDDSVKCWGSGGNGHLGQGNANNVGDGIGLAVSAIASINFGGGLTAKSVAAGGNHSCAILSDNSTKCWGSGNAGRLGRDDALTVGDGAIAVSASPAINFGGGRTATQIGLGSAHSCAILSDGAAICWGGNSQGELGQGNVARIGDGIGLDVSAAAAINLGVGRTATFIEGGQNANSTCAILDNGGIKCWGDNNNGAMGQNVATANFGNGVGPDVSAMAVVNIGGGLTVQKFGYGQYSKCVLASDDSFKCWSDNSSGQLGVDSNTDVGDGIGPDVDVSPFTAF